MIENKRAILEDLKIRFSYILGIIKNEMSIRYDDVDLYVLGLIFFKRLSDASPLVLDVPLHSYWKQIRNIASHLSYSTNTEMVAGKLDQIFHEVQISNRILESIFEGIRFKECNFLSSVFAIISYLDSIPLSIEDVPEDVMGEVFSFMIQSVTFNNSNYYLEVSDDLKRLMVEIIEPKPYEKIYDPVAGVGGLLAETVKFVAEKYNNQREFFIYGQERNKKIYTICRMSLIMHGVYDSEIVLGDTIMQPGYYYNDRLATFDKVISNIPFSVRRDYYTNEYYSDKYMRFKYGPPPRKSADYAFIQHIIASMKANGKAAVVIPDRILSSEGNEKHIRRHIIEDDVIEAVISLPDKFIKRSKVPFSILVMNKNKDPFRRKKILFVKAMPTIKTNKNDGRIINIDEILYSLKVFGEIEGVSRVVGLQDIELNDFNLNFRRYDYIFNENQDMLDSGSGKRLRDICEYIGDVFIRDTEYNPEGYPYVRIKDLSDSIRERFLNTYEVEKRALLSSRITLNRKAIIIALLGDKLKPTIFDPERSNSPEIILGQNLLAIIPNETFIDIEYIYYQLYSPRVLRQVEQLRSGIIPRIRKNDFLDIVIALPDYQKQEEYIKEQKLSLLEIESLRNAGKEQQDELESIALNAQREIISTLSHNALPYVFFIHNNIEILKKFLERRGLSNDLCEDQEQNYEVDDIDLLLASDISNTSETVNDVFIRLNSYLKVLEEYIDRTNKIIKLDLDQNDFENTNLCEFLRNYGEIKKKEIQGKYQLIIECAQNINLKIHRSSFQEVLNQLIRNAEMHAFDFSNKRVKYFVRFKVIENDEYITIIYSNNGKPFELSKESYISPLKKGRESSGQGLGGAYINRVVNAHGGKLEILDKEKGMEMYIVLQK